MLLLAGIFRHQVIFLTIINRYGIRAGSIPATILNTIKLYQL